MGRAAVSVGRRDMKEYVADKNKCAETSWRRRRWRPLSLNLRKHLQQVAIGIAEKQRAMSKGLVRRRREQRDALPYEFISALVDLGRGHLEGQLKRCAAVWRRRIARDSARLRQGQDVAAHAIFDPVRREGAPPILCISTYPRIVAFVANAAGHAPDRRTEPYWNALPDNPAARRGGLADITRTAGRVRSAPAYYDARFSLGCEILASHGGRCEHGDRDQSSRRELDCSHRTLLLASAT